MANILICYLKENCQCQLCSHGVSCIGSQQKAHSSGREIQRQEASSNRWLGSSEALLYVRIRGPQNVWGATVGRIKMLCVIYGWPLNNLLQGQFSESL